MHEMGHLDAHSARSNDIHITNFAVDIATQLANMNSAKNSPWRKLNGLS